MFICCFCPLENILLMLPTCSESVLLRVFCFWSVCYQKDKEFLSRLQLAQLFAKTSSPIEGQKQRSLFSLLQFTQFLVPSFLILRKEQTYWRFWINIGFFLCPCESRQPRCFLVKAIPFLVVVSCQNFLPVLCFT